MYLLYNVNVESHDSAILAETLRALSLAGMALARLLQVHSNIRILGDSPSSRLRFSAGVRGDHEVNEPDSTLSDLLSDLNAAGSRANALASRVASGDSRSARAGFNIIKDDDDDDE